jgi:hypothetical protein
MSPRLLRPRASGSAIVASDADARAYVLAVNTADGQPLEPAVQLAINTFIVGCKADGIWSAIKASCLLMGARTLSGALTPLVGTAPTNVNFVSGDYNRKTGLKGNANTKYLNSNRAGNADPQDNYHLAIYASEQATASLIYAGNGGAGTGATTLLRSADSGGTHRVRSRNATITGDLGHPLSGFFALSRSSSSSFLIRFGGANTTITQASETSATANFFVFARSSTDGTAAQFLSDARISFYSTGESLNLASLDSRLTTLYNAIGSAI